jgi:hypothetical protein
MKNECTDTEHWSNRAAINTFTLKTYGFTLNTPRPSITPKILAIMTLQRPNLQNL